MSWYLQDPSDARFYGHDFTNDLDEGDSIATHGCVAPGLTVAQVGRTGNVVRALLSGGVDGTFTVTWTATTSTGQTIERSDRIRVVQL